jgi:hypothetical protein
MPVRGASLSAQPPVEKNQEPRCQDPKNKYAKNKKKIQNKFQTINSKGLSKFGKPLEFIILYSFFNPWLFVFFL